MVGTFTKLSMRQGVKRQSTAASTVYSIPTEVVKMGYETIIRSVLLCMLQKRPTFFS